jgi:hypothetical protein
MLQLGVLASAQAAKDGSLPAVGPIPWRLSFRRERYL